MTTSTLLSIAAAVAALVALFAARQARRAARRTNERRRLAVAQVRGLRNRIVVAVGLIDRGDVDGARSWLLRLAGDEALLAELGELGDLVTELTGRDGPTVEPWCTCGAGEHQPPEAHRSPCLGARTSTA